MPPPTLRLTPWTATSELHQTFHLLFSSSATPTSQRQALDIISLWLVRGGCPHAIESTAALLAILLDDDDAHGRASSEASTSKTPLQPAASKVSRHALRQAYSMALTRFVNTLLDPLQQTYYARSLATLASEIGLPLWFVELRHAATHEDLPSLHVLRDAARQALDYLYLSYWVPLTSSPLSSTQTPSILPPSPALLAELKTYKQLTKLVLRDAAQAGKIKTKMDRVKSALEKETVEDVVKALVQGEGALIPLSKKKRSTKPTLLPTSLLELWLPLLTRLSNQHDAFQSLLVHRLVADLAAPGEEETSGSRDRTVMAWILYFLEPAGVADKEGMDQDGEEGEREEADELVENVVQQCLATPSASSIKFLEVLIEARAGDRPDLEPRLGTLIRVWKEGAAATGLTPRRQNSHNVAVPNQAVEEEDHVAIMERRLAEMEARLAKSLPTPTLRAAPTAATTTPTPRGWHLAEKWERGPIGMLPGGRIESLTLPVY